MKLCDRCGHSKPASFTKEEAQASGKDLRWPVRTVKLSPTELQKAPEPVQEIDLCRECEIELIILIQGFAKSKVRNPK